MKQWKSKEGYSLVELLIALTITAFVMAGMISLFAYATNSMSSTQARAALQDQAKDSVNHISTHVLEGTNALPCDMSFSGKTWKGLLISDKSIVLDETDHKEKVNYEWCLYWVAEDDEREDTDLLCFIKLRDLIKEVSPGDVSTDDEMNEYLKNFTDMSKEERLEELGKRLKALEDGGMQKGHFLCSNIKEFTCEIPPGKEMEDPEDPTKTIPVGRDTLQIKMKLQDEETEFESSKTITMRNQEGGN